MFGYCESNLYEAFERHGGCRKPRVLLNLLELFGGAGPLPTRLRVLKWRPLEPDTDNAVEGRKGTLKSFQIFEGGTTFRFSSRSSGAWRLII